MRNYNGRIRDSVSETEDAGGRVIWRIMVSFGDRGRVRVGFRAGCGVRRKTKVRVRVSLSQHHHSVRVSGLGHCCCEWLGLR